MLPLRLAYTVLGCVDDAEILEIELAKDHQRKESCWGPGSMLRGTTCADVFAQISRGPAC